jgi:hypothetical protein
VLPQFKKKKGKKKSNMGIRILSTVFINKTRREQMHNASITHFQK